MIPSKVYFTGLEFDPLPFIEERCIKGVIPSDWHRHRFILRQDAEYPVAKLNRWLTDNITGRWAIYMAPMSRRANNYRAREDREVIIAFENSHDGVMFVLADGKTEAFREQS